MTDQQQAEYASLWDSDAKNYVLFDRCPHNTDLGRYRIFNVKTQSVELIENRELVLEVIRRMLEAGVEVVSELPTSSKPSG